MFSAIADAYRRTQKPKDILWNRYVARPLAAVLLVPLFRTRVTPNQVTFASLAVFAAAAAILIVFPSHLGLIVGIVVLEISYVLDCVDGQLARMRGTSSAIGAHLDFLMDELKAFVLVAAVGLRLWLGSANDRWLLEGVVGVVVVASGISLTSFVRRPEYVAATGVAPPPASGDYGAAAHVPPAPPSPVRRVTGVIEAVGRFVIHYPSYLLFVAIANRLDLFLHAYVLVNAAHAARTLLGIARKLGRSAP